MITFSENQIHKGCIANDAKQKIFDVCNANGWEIIAMEIAQYWKKKIFWSDGYFVCSIGEVSSATIQKHIESQG